MLDQPGERTVYSPILGIPDGELASAQRPGTHRRWTGGQRHERRLGTVMPYPLRAFVRAAVAGACFFFFWLGALVLSWGVLPLASLSLRRRGPTERILRCQEIVGQGLRAFITSIRTLRIVVFRPSRVNLELPVRPFVMIANHPTLIDVTALMAVYPKICCVAKTEVFRSILAGPLLRHCGHIEGGDLSIMEGAAVIRQGLDRLKQGHPVLIFPEGTRSPSYGLRRFRAGAFEIALRAGVPIVPIVITCEPPTLGKGQPWYGLPKRTSMYDIIQLPVLPVGALGSDPQVVAARFQELFQAEIDRWKERLSMDEKKTSTSGPADVAGAPSKR